MNNIRFILESTSKKDLQSVTDYIIKAIKTTGAVKSGPVCFKNKKLIDAYNCNVKTIDYLMKIKKYPKVIITIDVDSLKS
jgi:ribosomal protein S10